MTLQESRQKRALLFKQHLAQELGVEFLNRLKIDLVNRLGGLREFAKTHTASEQRCHAANQFEPAVIMCAVADSADSVGFTVQKVDTGKNSFHYSRFITRSFAFISIRRSSKNSKKSNYYKNLLELNSDLVDSVQEDLFESKQFDKSSRSPRDLIFVCINIGWNSSKQIIDILFTIPHPTTGLAMYSFTFEDLIKDAEQQATRVNDEDVYLTLRKTLNETDEDEGGGS